jgi:hypothetical protein
MEKILENYQSLSWSRHPPLFFFLWNPKVNFSVHKSPPLVPILSQINSVQNLIYCYLPKIHQCHPPHLPLCFPQIQIFRLKFGIFQLFHTSYMPCVFYSPRFYHVIIFGEVMAAPLVQFPTITSYFFPPRS